MSQFPQDQGATTQVYPVVLQGGADDGIVEIGHIPRGLRRFSRPAALRLRRSSSGYSFLTAPCGTEKSLATRAGGIFEMGSSGLNGRQTP